MLVVVSGPGGERRVRERRPRRLLQVGMAVESGDLPEIAEVEHPLDVVDLRLGDAEPIDQVRSEHRVHPRTDLQAHDLAEAPAPKLGLDGLKQVVGLVGHLEVRVAGHPEQVVADDLDSREQGLEVLCDHVLERDEHVFGDLDEPREDLLGHLHAREHLVVEVGVAHPHDQAERQVGDVRERTAGADRERRQDREDLLAKAPLDRARRGSALLAADDSDAVLGQCRHDVVGELACLAAILAADRFGDPLEHLAW